MRARTLRLWLIGLVLVAAVISFVGTRSGNRMVGWLGFAVFLVAVFVYGVWRRAIAQERAARVFDRESKTDENRTRSDQ